MNAGKSVFSQVSDLYLRYAFNKIVSIFQGDFNTESFRCWDQLLSMSFAQRTFRSSLRDIEACLNAQPLKRYHLGIQGKPTWTNLGNVISQITFSPFGANLIKTPAAAGLTQ